MLLVVGRGGDGDENVEGIGEGSAEAELQSWSCLAGSFWSCMSHSCRLLQTLTLTRLAWKLVWARSDFSRAARLYSLFEGRGEFFDFRPDIFDVHFCTSSSCETLFPDTINDLDPSTPPSLNRRTTLTFAKMHLMFTEDKVSPTPPYLPPSRLGSMF